MLKKIVSLVIFCALSLPAFGQMYTVERVFEGDILRLANGELVRLIGVDCPAIADNEKALRDSDIYGVPVEEIIKMGEEAKSYTESLIAPGDQVRLEFDELERDNEGRLLAYVWYQEETCAQSTGEGWHLGCTPVETMLNEKLIEDGYAILRPSAPNLKNEKYFSMLFDQARKRKKGFWISRYW